MLSMPAGLSQGERPSPEPDGRAAAVMEYEFDDVEAVGRLAAEQMEPVTRATPQQRALAGVDGAARRTVIGARARFHLDKGKRLAVSAHEIDFSAASPSKIASQHAISPGSKP